MNSINQDRGFIGVGTPYFYPEGSERVLYLGNPRQARISLTSNQKTRVSHRKIDPGTVLDNDIQPSTSELTIETDTFQPLTWAMALMGTSEDKTMTVQTIADEPAKAYLSGYHQLKNRDIDPAGFEVKKGGTTIDPSKYSINYDMGLLQITDASAASDGDDLTVNYKTLASSTTVIDGARVTRFRGKIVIDGRNEVTGQRCSLTLPNVTLAVDGDFDWFSDDFNTVAMKGSAGGGKNGEPPYTVHIYK